MELHNAAGWTRRRMLTHAVGLSAAALTGALRINAADAAPKQAQFDPTSQYREQKLEGWRLLINTKFAVEQPDLADSLH